MGDLTGKRIDQTFDGLIKTNDEGPINAISFKGLQDGVGNNLPVQVSTIGVNFTGTVTGDNNTTYQIDAVGDGNNIVLEFLASDLTQQDITLIPGTDITFGLSNPNEITINSTGGGGGATYTINAVQSGLNVNLQLLADAVVVDTITLQAGGNVQLNQQGQAVVFSSTDTNTTYDFGAVGAAGNINFALSGSDTSNDVVTMQAGTNITLTDNGSNTFTIAASGGGGGAAGLINGTGPGSLKQADTLTPSSPANAAGDQAIALGNGAKALQPQGIAIGDGAESYDIGAIAIGQYAEASGTYSSAWGRTSAARAEGSVAFGQQAIVQNTEAGAVAMGRGILAVYPDTTHVRELMVVAPSGGTGGNGVILLSPNGTAYKITVDNAGGIISTLV